MAPTPTDRLHAHFGWRDFPAGFDGVSKCGLRFELGDPLPMGPLRFLRAMDRARAVARAAFASSVTLCAFVRVLGGERRSSRPSAMLRRLRDIGFAYDFGAAERVGQGDAEHIAEFGEDLCLYWYASDFPNDPAAVDALLWASVARGMDVIATSPERLAPIHDAFGAWLLDHDRAAMDALFASRAEATPEGRA